MRVKFSILVPLYNTPNVFLQDMIESVQNQIYKNWELCLTDASDKAHSYVEEMVKGYAEKDSRIKYKKLDKNRGISENTNACIDISTGNYLVMLDHDDILSKNALSEVVRVIQKTKADFIYSDEAKFTTSIEDWFAPNYKPNFSKYELRAHNYICHLTVYSRDLLNQVGRYRKECDGSQDHDMVLRLTEKARCIVHIPKILYYWRVHGESVSSGVENKSYAVDAAKNAIKDQIIRSGQKGDVVNHVPFLLMYHVLYEIKGTPCVTAVLYGCETPDIFGRCFDSIALNAGYNNLRYLIVTERKFEKEYQEILDRKCDKADYHIEVLDWSNKEEVNEILEKYGQDYLLFLNMNSRIDSKDFVRELLSLAQQSDVAFVGAKVMGRDNSVKQAGIALTNAVSKKVVFRFRGELAESDGYEGGLRHIRSVSAIADECMMIQTKKFRQINGFSKEFFWYSDVDACLKAREAGFDNVWTPYAEMTGYTSDNFPPKAETDIFSLKWKKVLAKEDPFYNKAIRYDVDNIHDKNTMLTLCKKSVEYFRTEGAAGLAERISVYRGGMGKRSSAHVAYTPQTAKKRVFKDVLFINGCAPTVPHPPRYRVTHQREQLAACNISSDEVYYENLELDLVRYYRLIIVFRCPYIEIVGEFIKRARELNKPVLYDIDDLVIDTKYTDTIPFVSRFDATSKRGYDDGVIRMGKTMQLCDAVITTTEGMAKELSRYMPEVFINRNTASERMYELSERAMYKRDIVPTVEAKVLPTWLKREEYSQALDMAERRKNGGVRIGYFSGSITHSDDFQMILPAVVRILKENPTVELHIVGELELPQELQAYKKQVVVNPFTEWERLPDLIASVDINLAPITESVFNEAKSENKWIEAALVKVPTVASNFGAFKHMITQNENGLLCETESEWYEALNILIKQSEKRKRLAESAYQFVKENCITIYTGKNLAEYIQKKFVQNIAFILPSTNTSGGVLVALKHMSFLKKAGRDVFIINEDRKNGYLSFEDEKIPVLSMEDTTFEGKIDKGVATMWKTVRFLEKHRNVKECYYLVQNYETNFYEPNNPLRIQAEQTYCPSFDLKYLTISKWCQTWLKEKYGILAEYMPNGIDCERFYPCERKFEGKIRILIEGDSSVYYKNVDESFRIVEQLDKSKYEIWYLSYDGKPKGWYHVDKFFNRVPYEKVADIYRQCHILLKSSILESFSYPPLEMMATGGFVVVAPNGGNVEYLVDGENCLMYPLGDIKTAVHKIQCISSELELQKSLYISGIRTAQKREWKNIQREIMQSYKIK